VRPVIAVLSISPVPPFRDSGSQAETPECMRGRQDTLVDLKISEPLSERVSGVRQAIARGLTPVPWDWVSFGFINNLFCFHLSTFTLHLFPSPFERVYPTNPRSDTPLSVITFV